VNSSGEEMVVKVRKPYTITKQRERQYHNCEDCFIIRLHLIPLISGQRGEKFYDNFLILQPNTAFSSTCPLPPILPWLCRG